MRKFSIQDKIFAILANLFGIGYTPLCPGTAASLVAVLVYLFIKSSFNFVVFTGVVIIISFLVSTKAEKVFGEKDSKKIVIDDFSGMLITFLFIPRDFVLENILFIPAAFFLFRMLDMIKIPPADRIEKLPGAKGVVGDDVVAGIYACLVLHAVKGLLAIIS